MAADTSIDENTRARALFRRGVDAFRAGKNEQAADALAQAWAIRNTYDVAGALAQAELALGRYREAAEHLDYCVSHFSPAESERSLGQVKAALADVKKRVATLHVSVVGAGAHVQLDARNLGVSPLNAAVFVDPGVHTLQGQLGSVNLSQVVNVQAGKEYPLSVRFGGTGSEPSSALGLNPPEQLQSSVPVILGGSVAVIGAVGLIAFSMKASSANDRRQALQDKNGSSGCADGGSASAADCAAQRAAARSRDRDRNLAIASAVVGVVGVVAIPVYLFFPRHRDASEAQASSNLGLHLALGASSVSLAGQF